MFAAWAQLYQGMYRVFHRTWWQENPSWPDGREPKIGHKKPIAEDIETEQEARAICKRWNADHKPGKLSDKAEYEEQ